MGCINCNAPKEMERKANESIKQQMIKKEKEESNVIEILLIGPSGSGTTTLLKQTRIIQHIKSLTMKRIYLLTNGYIRNMEQNELNNQLIPISINELCIKYYNIYDENIDIAKEKKKEILQSFASYINCQMIEYSFLLCNTVSNQGIALPNDVAISKTFLQNPDTNYDLTSDMVDHMKILWNCNVIKEIERTQLQSSKHCASCNLAYFFDNRLDDICKNDYLPTFEDYIKIRMRTTGFTTERFDNKFGNNPDKQYKIDITDFGGVRAERKKWLNLLHFHNGGIMYVVALDDYCCPCFEDSNTLRLQESLNLFREILKNGCLDHKNILLIFNKYDSLLRKLENNKLETIDKYFHNFPIDKNPKNANHIIQFIYNLFINLYKNEGGNIQNIPNYKVISAIDTAAVDIIFGEFIDNILKDTVTAKRVI